MGDKNEMLHCAMGDHMKPRSAFTSNPHFARGCLPSCKECFYGKVRVAWTPDKREAASRRGGAVWSEDGVTKKCLKCHRIKPLDDFSVQRSRPDGYTTWCKECRNTATQQSRQDDGERWHGYRTKAYWADPERFRAEVRRSTRNARLQAIFVYAGDDPMCACCGDPHLEFMTIDHINNDGAAHRRELNTRGGDKFYRWLRNNNYPPGFQILCFNCNHAKAIYGVCPHQADLHPEGS